jgi:uncharacterized protein (TIGR03790 family)
VLLGAAAALAGGAETLAQPAPMPGAILPPTLAPASAASQPRATSWAAVPRATGRLRNADLGLVINSADPASVQVGEHYIAARGLQPEQVLRVELPVKTTLTLPEFEALQRAIEQHFGARTQALALAWNQPYKVECNSITGALALGFDAELCKNTCGQSRMSRYFNSPSGRPFTELGLRPAMLIAAPTVEGAKALIDRGVASDGSMLLRGRPPVNVMMLTTDDGARRVRQVLYPPTGLLRAIGVEVFQQPEITLPDAKRLLMAVTGSVRPLLLPPPEWVPGGVGDHLTSFGGDLYGAHGQGTVFDWIVSGATGSHGAVTEPCNHLQKFPHPQLLLGHYLQGETLIEAYWKSVAWPQQSLFVGEPLAGPFGRRR